MEELINRYNEKCALKSKCANLIWKAGLIIETVIFLITFFIQNNYMIFIRYCILYFISIFILDIFCEVIFTISISKRIKDEKIPKPFELIKYRKNLNRTIEKMQKDWIRKYCMKNKLNKKMDIIIKELNTEIKDSEIKYINPVVIGTLLIPIWEKLVEIMVNNMGFKNMLIIAGIFIIVFSILSGQFLKNCTVYTKMFKQFEKYSGKKRLKELLILVVMHG